jgi:hypothetical protein
VQFNRYVPNGRGFTSKETIILKIEVQNFPDLSSHILNCSICNNTSNLYSEILTATLLLSFSNTRTDTRLPFVFVVMNGFYYKIAYVI